uniref:FZ domain-containing protein n=1 Tax=Nothoprocta perdicaria TaxID=30464 RepID=A0A8C6ZPN8_NOTPE
MFWVAKMLALALSSFLGRARGFDIGLSTKCVAIPQEMAMCQKVGYSEMRLPNLLGHTSLEEVVLRATAWQRLARTDCHPLVRTFLSAPGPAPGPGLGLGLGPPSRPGPRRGGTARGRLVAMARPGPA